MKDLIVLVADKNIEATISGLLSRPQAIGIRDVSYEVKAHPRRDPGCFREAHTFLRLLRGQYRHALVVFDKDWTGSPEATATDVEKTVCDRLVPDWADAARALVIDPELEVWVWSDSPHVDTVLGWRERDPALRTWLKSRGGWLEGQSKPVDPKWAVEEALRAVRLPRSSSVYGDLARKVSIDRCSDQSFSRLLSVLRDWFASG